MAPLLKHAQQQQQQQCATAAVPKAALCKGAWLYPPQTPSLIARGKALITAASQCPQPWCQG